MKILVTGTTGLVGEAVAQRLAELGHRVVGVSRNINPRLPGSVKQVQADLGQASFLHTFEGSHVCEAIVHCAAERNPTPGAAEVVLVNCLGTQQVAALARQWKVRSLVFMSGVAVIGRPVETPVVEEHPVRPLNEYIATKLFGEHVTEIAGREPGICASTLRLTAPVGTNMPRNRLLPAIVEKALLGRGIEINGDGSRRQNYVAVGDVARAVEQVLEGNVSGLFNIGGPACISNLELARLCVRILNSTSEVRLSGRPDPEDGVAWDISSAKARNAFGYQPRIGIEETMRALGAGMRE